jgi:hypothetical protein
MVQLKLNQISRGIHQKTIIQQILRFSDTITCFQKFRLVCKSWKDAVETIRFHRMFNWNAFYDLNGRMKSTEGILQTACYFSKYMQLFKKLWMPLGLENEKQIFALVLQNMKKLNEITFDPECEELGEEFNSFAFKLLQNSHTTLRTLDVPKFVIPDIHFPNLTNLDLSIGLNHISLQEFKMSFSKVLQNMENLETVGVGLLANSWYDVGEYICDNYANHCISASDPETLGVMPVKILQEIGRLVPSFENKKYISHLQYLHVYIFDPEDLMDHGWDRYHEIFDQCINLKAIEFDFNGNFMEEILPNLSEANQEIWKERILYFQTRGIHLVGHNKIYDNEKLRNKLAKNAGVKWKFHFY